jgi:hypothetical protein
MGLPPGDCFQVIDGFYGWPRIAGLAVFRFWFACGADQDKSKEIE